jgi:hypothetical protein
MFWGTVATLWKALCSFIIPTHELSWPWVNESAELPLWGCLCSVLLFGASLSEFTPCPGRKQRNGCYFLSVLDAVSSPPPSLLSYSFFFLLPPSFFFLRNTLLIGFPIKSVCWVPLQWMTWGCTRGGSGLWFDIRNSVWERALWLPPGRDLGDFLGGFGDQYGYYPRVARSSMAPSNREEVNRGKLITWGLVPLPGYYFSPNLLSRSWPLFS